MLPDFSRDHYEGQMVPRERKLLYDTIVEIKPIICFEVGTWKGGGSTYFITSGLEENKRGILYTVEIEEECYWHAVNLYKTDLVQLRSYVSFNRGDSLEVYPDILEQVKRVDFLLLDGKEDSEQTVKEFEMFNSYTHEDSILICHDWGTTKMLKLKEVIKKDTAWKLLTILEDTPTQMGVFTHA